jgi:hypothetical protein
MKFQVNAFPPGDADTKVYGPFDLVNIVGRDFRVIAVGDDYHRLAKFNHATGNWIFNDGFEALGFRIDAIA